MQNCKSYGEPKSARGFAPEPYLYHLNCGLWTNNKMNPSSSSSSTTPSYRHLQEKQQLSRLLYGNPVCLLTTAKRPILGYHHANAMTISWLTPVDNQGNIFLSINTKRHTAERLMKEFTMGKNDPSSDNSTTTTSNNQTMDENDDDDPRIESHDGTSKTYFVLNVPTAGQEDMVLRIGGCSGRDVDKFAEDNQVPVKNGIADEVENHEEEKEHLPTRSFTLCRPGWTTDCSTEGSGETTVASSMSQTATSPSPIPSSAVKGEEEIASSSNSIRRRQKAVRNKKKSPAEDYCSGYGGGLVAISECIAHIVCR